MSTLICVDLDLTLSMTHNINDASYMMGVSYEEGSALNHRDWNEVLSGLKDNKKEAIDKLQILCQQRSIRIFRGIKNPNHIYLTKLRPHATEMLAKLRNMADKLCLITKGQFAFQHKILKLHEIYGFFDAFFTNQDLDTGPKFENDQFDKKILIDDAHNPIDLFPKYLLMGVDRKEVCTYTGMAPVADAKYLVRVQMYTSVKLHTDEILKEVPERVVGKLMTQGNIILV